jgi:hypothetical protein
MGFDSGVARRGTTKQTAPTRRFALDAKRLVTLLQNVQVPRIIRSVCMALVSQIRVTIF